MSNGGTRLYDLLPAVHRERDAELGGPLEAYLSVFEDELRVLEENLSQSYDDLFVETCAEWVLPYIGDLIGYRTLHGKAEKVASRRAEVANTIGYRRRKGTAAMLEQLARDVTGWDARVVEYFTVLATTQHMNHVRPENRRTPFIRQPDRGVWDVQASEVLERVDTAFDSVAHTVDVRSIGKGQGRYNIRNIGVFLWRIDDFSLTASPAVPAPAGGVVNRFFFSPLRHDLQLFTFPTSEDEVTSLATPLNVPEAISRGIMHRGLASYYDAAAPADDAPGGSIRITVGSEHPDGVPLASIEVCDLSDASNTWVDPPVDRVTVDPELGRLTIPRDWDGDDVRVTYRYGFSRAMGGGEYERGDSDLGTVQVSAPSPIQPEITAAVNGGAVELQGSDRFVENPVLHVEAPADATAELELRSANGSRATLVLGTVNADTTELLITGTRPAVPAGQEPPDAEVTVDGLIITGGKLRVPLERAPGVANELSKLTLRHCTLVPGLTLGTDGEPDHPDEPSLIIDLADVDVHIEDCIVGALRVAEGSTVEIENSVVDATAAAGVAYSAPGPLPAGGVPRPGGPLSCDNVTIFGKLTAREMPLVSNTIFESELAEGDAWLTPVYAERKQTGCVRFSFVPVGSRTPRRYRCQPDLAIHDAIVEVTRRGPEPDTARKARLARGVADRIKPYFSQSRYGRANYAQLRTACVPEITKGADDEVEMGAFHDNYQAQRESDLRTRLDEYLRFGLEAGIMYARQEIKRRGAP